MTHEMRHRQAREFQAATRYLDASTVAPLHDVVRELVERCPSLEYDYLSILLGDWAQQFRLENQAEVDDALLRALKVRAA